MCWSHFDLDGIVSYLILRWTFPNAIIDYQLSTVQKFRNEYIKWLTNHNLEDYDKVYILDLGIFDDKDLIDHENVVIIDHHPGHTNTTYKKAKTVIKEDYSSACKLVYKVFKALYNINLTKPQLHLLILANDFDSYTLQFKESKKLNIVFWDTNDRFESFIKSFAGGFHGFTFNQENIIKLHDIKLEKIKSDLKVFTGVVKIQGKNRRVCSAMVTQYINEVADILIEDYNAEVAIIVNIKTKHISYRRNPNSDVNLSELAKKIGNGHGHEYSSGSELSEDFILFTKNLKEVDKLVL